MPSNSVFTKTHSHSKTTRQVSKEQGEELAKQTHSAFVETSAKTNSNVGAWFSAPLSRQQMI